MMFKLRSDLESFFFDFGTTQYHSIHTRKYRGCHPDIDNF
jgi:hypothetical protein